MYSNYDDIRRAIRNAHEFQGNSARGEYQQGGSVFAVYSYRTCIFRYEVASDTVLMFDARYYSCTTSRLQNILRKYYDVNNAGNVYRDSKEA